VLRHWNASRFPSLSRAGPTTVASVHAGLDHCVIAVSDWERSNAFYRDVLGAELVARERGWAYRFGGQQLNVHGPGMSPGPVARLPVRPGNSDLCFVWDGPINGAIAHLAQRSVTLEEGPVERHGACGEGRSIYFRDPDGALLEVISYR
jgi:catechol 2,3-dioxygenase-like lactoylglutathione lyase family enzyme